MEQGADVGGGDPASAHQPVAVLHVRQRVEVPLDATHRPAAADDQDRLQIRQFLADAGHLVPDVVTLPGRQCNQHLGPGRPQDVGNMSGFEVGIDRICNAGGLGAIQGDESLRHQRKQQADDIGRADPQRMQHVCDLRDAGMKLGMRDRHRLFIGAGVGQEVQGRALRVVGSPQAQRLISTLRGNPLLVRNSFEGAQVGVGGEARPFSADDAIQQMKAGHDVCLLSLPAGI